MPFNADDQRHDHLRIAAEQQNPDRRKRQGFGSPAPARGSRKDFARELTDQLDSMKQEVQSQPSLPAGIQPHLVFRVPLAQKAPVVAVQEALGKAGITVVGVEGDNAIVAFHDDLAVTELRKGIANYAAGPGVNQQTGERYKSTSWDVLAFIEAAAMRRWSASDRIGQRLAELIGPAGDAIEDGRLYILDVELWHQGTQAKASQTLREFREIIRESAGEGERVRDDFAGDTLCLARVSCRGAKLRRLLSLDDVADIDLPPVPLFDDRMARDVTPRNFPIPPRPPEDGPRVCVLDSGVASSHPLLANNVGHAVAILTPETSPDDGHGHGTMVSGIAVFGDVRACYEQGAFASSVTLFSGRVLNEHNRFDDEKLIIHQMRDAIAFFAASPYDCRVFNVSLGDHKPWLASNQRQSQWAESLDVLARELKVLIVVSAGNHNLGWARTTGDAEATLTDYPQYLFQPECGLCEPATAAIPITVAGIANQTIPKVAHGSQGDSLSRNVAEIGEPTPTTRIGPGMNDAVKPEFVAPAGNTLFHGVSTARQATDEDPGLAIMSFSHRPIERLFSFDSGTSFAAPFVARQAAIVFRRLAEFLGTDPHPNLVRAVLASSATVPDVAQQRVAQVQGEDGVRRAYGYGAIDEDFALNSGDRRVVLLEQSAIRIDSFLVFEIPVPVAFQNAQGKKHITVSLAFDPPVRRRRAEYLGVQMWTGLIRGKSIDEVVEAYRAETSEERAAIGRNERDRQGAFKSPFKCSLEPGPQTLESSTLQKSTWTMTRNVNDYGENWYLVVRAERTWAPPNIVDQDFAVAVTLQADEPQLYNLIQQRVRARQQLRARARG